MGEDALNLVAREDDGQAFGSLGTHRVDIAEVLMKNITIEKENGAEGLVLGRSSDVFVQSEMGQELFDFGCAHLTRMAFVMKKNRAFDPIHVSFFSAEGIVFDADGSLDLVEQFFLGWRFHWATC